MKTIIRTNHTWRQFRYADDLYTLWHDASDHCGWSTEHDSEGTRFNFSDALKHVTF